MRKITLCLLLALTLLINACGQTATPPAVPTLVLEARPAAATRRVTASAQVIPLRKAELSFPLTGMVKSVDVKEGEAVKAGQILAALDTTILEAHVREAAANLAAAQAQVRYLERVGTSRETLAAAQAEMDRAQAVLDSERATLAQATLTAPFDGLVAVVNIAPAETVVPGQVVIVIGDVSRLRVETTDLSERDVPLVQAGQPARVFVPALGVQIAGAVFDVARMASTLGGDVVYRVIVDLAEQPPGLRWGMTADVEIQVEP